MNLESLNPILLALIGTIFTWLMTAAGASLVFFVKRIQTWFMDTMMGFAAGVMIAASFWSLLNPAMEMTKGNPFPAAIGFLAGGLFLFAADKLLPHEHLSEETCSSEGLKTPGVNPLYCFWQLQCTIFQKDWLSVLPMELWLMAWKLLP